MNTTENQPFVIERTYDAPVPPCMEGNYKQSRNEKWYFDLADFKPEIGFEFSFEGGPDEKKYLHLCKITEVIPNKKLSYTWKYDGYEGISTVTFELFNEGGKTRLKLTHAGLETFPKSNPDLAKENFAAGWTEIIGTSLKNYLEKV